MDENLVILKNLTEVCGTGFHARLSVAWELHLHPARGNSSSLIISIFSSHDLAWEAWEEHRYPFVPDFNPQKRISQENQPTFF
jgi:hypothetical protein